MGKLPERETCVAEAELMVDKLTAFSDVIKKDPSAAAIGKDMANLAQEIKGKLLSFASLCQNMERMDAKMDQLKTAGGMMKVALSPIQGAKAVKGLFEFTSDLKQEYKGDVAKIGELIEKGQEKINEYKSHFKQASNPSLGVENKENVDPPKMKP